MLLDKALNRTIELSSNYGNELYIPLPYPISYTAIEFDDDPMYFPSARLVYRLRSIRESTFGCFYMYQFDRVETR